MNIHQYINFGDYPFYVGVREAKGFRDIPSSIPFKIFIDQDTAIPTLDITEEIKTALSIAYGQGSMLSTPLGIGRLGLTRMDEFIDNLTAYLGDLAGKKILEIGCGEGHLLARLQELGAHVVGLEIGPQGKIAEQNYGIEVINKPLEDVSLNETYDAIISYGCLEHIIDIKALVKQCHDLLNSGGVMFHSVPNTENTIMNFRFDDLCHQHVNYFSPTNAKSFFLQNCFEDVVCEPTNAGNEIYMMARSGGKNDFINTIQASDIDDTIKHWEQFSEQLGNLRNNFKKNLTSLLRNGRVGFYGGGHILTQITGMGQKVDYFDSDIIKHGQSWLAGLPTIISPQSLLDDPVSNLVIGPEHHMAAISSYLFSEIGLPASIQLKPISDLYAP